MDEKEIIIMFKKCLFAVFFIISIMTAFALLVLDGLLGTEGNRFEDLWSYSGIFLILTLIIIVWFLIARKTAATYVKMLSYICIILTFISWFMTLLFIGKIIKNEIQSRYYTKHASITHYQESWIQWPGFSYPVGLKMEIDLPTPFIPDKKYDAGFYSPLIWMGPRIDLTVVKNNYYKTLNWQWALQTGDNSSSVAILKEVVFNSLNKSNNIDTQGENSKIIFCIYPGIIEYLNSEKAFCTFTNASSDIWTHRDAPTIYTSGGQLNAMWFEYNGQFLVDLSDPLSSVLQRSSHLENNPALWINMHKQFDDNNLLKLGYHQCELDTRTHCFCK